MTDFDFAGLHAAIQGKRFASAGGRLALLERSAGRTWEFWKWRALLLERMGRSGEAMLCMRRAIPLSPDPSGLRKELSRMRENARVRTAAATGRPQGGPLVLRLTSACNQRCPFCFALGTDVSPDSSSPGLGLLRLRGRREETLALSGGEPTLFPRLDAFVARARRAGFRRLSLQTNAVLLRDERRVRRLLRSGLRDFFVSFHSHLPALYDRLTGTRGQYPAALRGLESLLRQPDCRVTVNIVVTALNHRRLPAHVRFLSRLARGRPARLGVFFSMLNDVGLRRAPSLGVSVSRTAPSLRAAAALCRKEGLALAEPAGDCAFPPCILGHAPAAPQPQTGLLYARKAPGTLPPGGRLKRTDCRRCPQDRFCLGVSVGYARRFGLAGLLRDPRASGKRRRGAGPR